MNPQLRTYLRLTLLIAGAIVLLFVLGFLVKIVIVAAIIAALVLAGMFVYHFFRKRSGMPVNR